MCRLFGLIANKEVDIRFSFIQASPSFQSLGQANPDGWGIGWYEKNKPVVKKDPIPAHVSDTALRVAENINSRIIVSHVRKATTGVRSKKNCHPFSSGDWLFAHNGCIDRNSLIKCLEEPFKMAISGETDSEVYFLYILQNIKNEGDVIVGIKKAINEVRKYDHTGLNFILTDGISLYGYRDAISNINYYTLYYLKRVTYGKDPINFRSKELNTLLESKSLNHEKAVIICSERLTEEDWIEIPLRSLLIASRELEIKIIKEI